MQILYITSVPSKKEFVRIKERTRASVDVSTYGMTESGFKFHSLILEGLRTMDNIQILSLVGRSVCLKFHKGVFWKSREESDENIQYKHLGLINLPGLKQLFLGLSFFFNTLAWLVRFRSEPDKSIVMDAAYVTVLPYVLFAASLFKCRKAAIFCDIYSYMGDVRDARTKSNPVHRLVRRMVQAQYKKLDGFILLTEAMNEVVNKLKKPYIVIEGLVDIRMKGYSNRPEDKNPDDVVLYAGALREQYGLKNLMDGFMDYKNPKARLWIFGAGDYSESVQKAAEKDPRILFHGLADNADVVNKETEASLLINPRPVDQEFTKYSFPSKNMEYMVSGTPVLTTKLPGMPLDYYPFVYTISGNTAKDITMALESTFNEKREKLNQKGNLAKIFVLENKNNLVQTAKIIGLLKGIHL